MEPISPPGEPRQRWRITYRIASDAAVPTRDRRAAWETAVRATGLPVAGLDADPPRPRLLHGPPLADGITGEREPLDVVLSERLPVSEVRARLVPHLPPGVSLVDLHDIWLGAPSITADALGAVYRVRIDGPSDRTALAAGAARLLGSSTLPRRRPKGDRSVDYDLRPLLGDIRIADERLRDDRPLELEIEVRFDAALGAGRPDEVVAALAELLGSPLPVLATTRVRVILAGDSRPG